MGMKARFATYGEMLRGKFNIVAKVKVFGTFESGGERYGRTWLDFGFRFLR